MARELVTHELVTRELSRQRFIGQYLIIRGLLAKEATSYSNLSNLLQHFSSTGPTLGL
jgi:hypothetical protein